MIFATIDLVNYLRGRGRYSPKSLQASGMQLATEDNFAGQNEATAGNFFFLHYRRSVLSWLIMYLTHSTISHTGVHLGGGYIEDVTISGSGIRRLSELLDNRSWLCDTREIFGNLPPQVMDDIAAHAVANTGKDYNWIASAWIGWQAVTDSNYPRQPRHPRLWVDTLLSLLLPSLLALVHRGRTGRVGLAPAVLYIVILARNELGRMATNRVRRLQETGRITLSDSTYWRKGEPEVRSPGDIMREMIAIRKAQLGLAPIPDTPLATDHVGGRRPRPPTASA